METAELMYPMGGLLLSHATTDGTKAKTQPSVNVSGKRIEVSLPMGSTPASSYDPNILVWMHPGSFPWGKGGRPMVGKKLMSFIKYGRIILGCAPLIQFGMNAALLFDIFDIWQRMEVGTNTNVVLKQYPSLLKDIGPISEKDVNLAVACVTQTGSTQAKTYELMSAASRKIAQAMKTIGKRVVASPLQKGALRSDTFDSIGNPIGRSESITENLRYVAKNFTACAHFFRVYFLAFNDIICGWPLGDKKQKNPQCMMGPIEYLAWVFEESGRRGIHSHGQARQSVMAVANLKRLFEHEDKAMRGYLLSFGEAIMRQSLPSVIESKMPKTILSTLEENRKIMVRTCYLIVGHKEVHPDYSRFPCTFFKIEWDPSVLIERPNMVLNSEGRCFTWEVGDSLPRSKVKAYKKEVEDGSLLPDTS